jgi:hypothetical protein
MNTDLPLCCATYELGTKHDPRLAVSADCRALPGGGDLAALVAGDPVWVMDDNGSAGWPGQVIAVSADALEVSYAGWTEAFRLSDGRNGPRYLTTGKTP